MSIVTFDTLKALHRLMEAGFSEQQAEAVIRVLAAAQDDLVSKRDLDIALTNAVATLKADLVVLKWGMGVTVAGVISLIVKAFA